MKVETSRWGSVEIPEEHVITFPEGLPGFEGKQYVLIHPENNPLVHWLQSADDPDVALILMDPIEIDPTWSINPRPQELKPIEATEHEDDGVLCKVIVRAGDNEGELYCNLFAPVLFNVEARLAMQLPLVGSPYSVREVWPKKPES